MKARTLFTLVLLAFTGTLIVECLTLSAPSRAAPLWVLVPTAVLLMAQLLADILSRFRRPRDHGGGAGPERSFDARSVGGPEWSRRDAVRWRGARITGWLLLLLGLVEACGFFVAVPLFVVPYLRVEGGLRWGASILFAGALVGALFLVFGVWVDVPFPEGRFYRIAAAVR